MTSTVVLPGRISNAESAEQIGVARMQVTV